MWRTEAHPHLAAELAAEVLAEVLQLVDLVADHDGFRPVSDQVWLDLHQHLLDPADGVTAIVLSRHPDGELAAYAQVTRTNAAWSIELVIHPAHRQHASVLATQTLRAALQIVTDGGGGSVQWWTFRPADHIAQVAVSVGLNAGRELLQMRRDLPLGDELTAGEPIRTRPFVVGSDEQAWLEVNNAAFHWHPEQGGWDLTAVLQRERAPWFDPSGLLMHERDGRLAGFCWTKVHSNASPPMGEIYVIAVHPDFHGLGLGKALTVAGLQSLTARGLSVGMLHVDADNISAVSLYRRLGFHTDHTDRVYVGHIERTTA